MEKWEHRVIKISEPTRIVDYVGEAFHMLGSRTAARKAIADGRITLNGKKVYPSDMIKENDKIVLKGTGVSKARKFDFDIEVVFEDDYLILVNKPAGIAVNGDRNKTVENALARIRKSNAEDALPRPVAVHRLDVPTKGLVLLAKTKSALIRLGRAFENNEIDKQYYAVVHGIPDKQGIVTKKIEGKDSETHYFLERTVKSRVFENFSMVRLKPITGRTHQLRIHLASIGNLVVGDRLYAKEKRTILGKGLYLCACKLSFTHPITKKQVMFAIDPPQRFFRLMDREESRF